MALRVWLPFNGNSKNQGLSDNNTTLYNTIAYSAGKLGQCIDFSNNASAASGSESLATIPGLQLNNFTICAWIKVTSTATEDRFVAREGRGYNADGWNIRIEKNTNKISMGAENSYQVFDDTGALNTWYHVAMVHSDDLSHNYWYLNGNYFFDVGGSQMTYDTTTGEGNSIVIGARTKSGSYHWPFDGCVNDFRIYDECLSQKQIKEISRGLVAHYKLTGVGANSNLLVNAGNRSQWTYESCTRVNDTDPKVIGFSVSSANQRIYLGVTNVWNSGQKYTYSFDAKASVNDAQLDASRSIADFGPNHYLTTEWQHYSGKISSTTTADAGTLSIRGKTANTTYYLKNIKLENGEEETHYIPNINDIEYTTLGYENDICTDVSGNGYTATKSGTLTFNSDSPRYEGSTTFTSGLVNSPACAVLANSKDFSINGWFYRTGGATITYYASAENYNTSVDLEGGRYFVYGSNGTAYVGNWTSAANTWQMITLVHDSVAKTLSLYVNGNYISQVATSGDVYANNTLNIGGRQGSANFAGSISDFRIYATVLSANDILTMYKNSGIIDNKGNVYAYEFKEE